MRNRLGKAFRTSAALGLLVAGWTQGPVTCQTRRISRAAACPACSSLLWALIAATTTETLPPTLAGCALRSRSWENDAAPHFRTHAPPDAYGHTSV